MTDLSGQYLGRYYLKEQLGEGGMAVVYKAYDTRLERDVAVKIIRSGAFPTDALTEVLKRFEREAKALAKFSHPNIVKVHDYGEYEGSPYLVMEYLSGGTLKKLLGELIPWRDAVRLILPVARSVSYAHHRGVLHRDIKPANILITESGEPMLSDFGIAKMFEGEQTTALTGSGMAIGTPEYMAPEQWTGTTSPGSDLYSLGVVLYEMVAGRKPYVADTPAAILIKQATEPLPSPRKFANDLPEALELVLVKALAKEPNDRYQDVTAFVTALENLLARGTESQKFMEAKHPGISSSPKVSFRRMGWLIGGTVFVLGVWLGSPLIGKWFSPAPVMTESVTATFTLPSQLVVPSQTPKLMPVSETPTITITPTENFTPTTTPMSIEIKDDKGVSMMLVPAGEFTMGSEDGISNEQPVHKVYQDAFFMDKYEVTNVHYRACVDSGTCTPPKQTGLIDRPGYYGNLEFNDYPVIYINWNQANTYCKWRGGGLPTEAQWEKAARGTDARTYPWGEGLDCDRASAWAGYGGCSNTTVKVGSYESGKSPYGAYDMAGNVQEWVADWYGADYYNNSPTSNPLGPNLGQYRVLRGGSFIGDVRSSYRNFSIPTYIQSDTGFRCAKDVP